MTTESNIKHFVGAKDFKIFTRSSRSKNYEYVVIAKTRKSQAGWREEDHKNWEAENWCGRLDLARAKAKENQKYFVNVEILPVFEKSAKEVKELKADLARCAQARAEAEAAEEAAQKAQAEAQARAEEAKAQVWRAVLQTAQDEAAREAAAYQAATQAALFNEFEAEAARQAQAREEADVTDFIMLVEQAEEKAQEGPQGAQAVPEGYAPSLICKRCGKILTGPESVARGYGDKCWRKVWKVVKGVEPPVPDQDQSTRHGTISDPAAAYKTRLEIDRRIVASEEKCLCGAPAADGELWTYDHEGGYRVPGYLHPQWFYTECSKCGYQFSLRKMASVDIEDLETEGRREAGVRLAEEEARKGLSSKKIKAREKATEAAFIAKINELDAQNDAKQSQEAPEPTEAERKAPEYQEYKDVPGVIGYDPSKPMPLYGLGKARKAKKAARQAQEGQ